MELVGQVVLKKWHEQLEDLPMPLSVEMNLIVELDGKVPLRQFHEQVRAARDSIHFFAD